MEKTKICKHCKEEINNKAKVCPHCQKKQSGIVKWIALGVLAIIIIAAVAGQGETEKEEKKRKKDFSQNEVATYKNVKYSIIKVEKTQGNNEYFKPKEGYEYVKVTLKIENNSDKKISYNPLDWQMVNADGQEDAWGTYTADNDNTLSSGDLDAGGKVEGVLVWEQKIGDNSLRLRYYNNALFDDKYTLQFKLY